jgi:CubicO group peptidase (beta-lactamase class C family)
MRQSPRAWLRLALWLAIVLLLAACRPSSSIRSPTPTLAPSASIRSPTLTPAPGSVAADAAAEDAYLSHLAAAGTFRGSVLLARADAVLLSKGYGLADEAGQFPNTPQTRFRIGSITKQFTAMAILLLQERGKLSVQDRLCRYISDCPSDWQPITLQHLLTHTSGIPDYINSPTFPQYIGTPATLAQLIDRFKTLPLLFTPGERWSYSNSGYTLLGYIIEEVSGASYAQFLQENIFDPLQMSNTGYDTNNPQPPQHATGYLQPHVKPVYLDMSEFYAAGALYSTVEDLYRWDQALVTNRLVSEQTMASMFTVYIPCPDGGCALASDLGYGYGWFIAAVSGQRLIYHLGHIDGFLTFNGFYSSSSVDVIVLSNLDSSPVLSISTRLGSMVLGTAA